MKNDTRSHVFNRHPALRIGMPVALLAFYVSQAWADVPPPPPSYTKPIDTSFPSGKALERQGYDSKTGVLKVNVNKDGRPKVSSNGSTVTGTQNVRITATDAYGNKATIGGRITQTANTAIIGAYIGGALSQGLEKYGEQAVNDIRDGRYSDAVRSTAGGAATVINAFSGGVFGSVYKVADKALGTNVMGSNPSANSSAAADSVVGNVMGAIGKGGSPSSQSSGLGRAANAAASAQSAAEKNGDIGGALGAAAVGKAAGAAAQAANAAAQTSGGSNFQQQSQNQKPGYKLYKVSAEGVYKDSSGVYRQDINAKIMSLRAPVKYSWVYVNSSQSRNLEQQGYPVLKRKGLLNDRFDISSTLISNESDYASAVSSSVSVQPSDMTLSGDDIKDVLDRMFSSQQTNHAAMMSALSQIAANTAPKSPSTSESSVGSSQSSDSRSQVVRSGPSIVDKATTSYTVSGDSAISAPYTPAGSDTPQQTRFDVNADGTVTSTAVPRPDLKPHSSQAPTRHSVAPSAPNTKGSTQDAPSVPNQNHGTQANTNQGQHGQQSGQNQQQNDRQNFCQLNPNAACIPPGNADYEDLSIPESVIDLSFQPADIFQTDGVCPQPKTVDLGIYGVQEFSYQPLCDFAAALRPILIAATIMMCAWFAYGALGEA